MKITDISIKKLLAIYDKLGYPVNNREGSKFELNIGAIRTNNITADKYDDFEFVFRKAPKPSNPTINTPDWIRRYELGYILDVFVVTTNPSTSLLLKPINKNGTAIVVPGYYSKVWRFGNHKNDKNHPALVQVRTISVYRDNNKDYKLDYNGVIENGLFGINNHRASSWKITDYIGLNSAGCIVHKNVTNYNNVFIWTIKESLKERNKDFDFALITENEYTCV